MIIHQSTTATVVLRLAPIKNYSGSFGFVGTRMDSHYLIKTLIKFSNYEETQLVISEVIGEWP